MLMRGESDILSPCFLLLAMWISAGQGSQRRDRDARPVAGVTEMRECRGA
jgi:hypothetical protein